MRVQFGLGAVQPTIRQTNPAFRARHEHDFDAPCEGGGRCLDVFLGLTPQAESYCSIGAETEMLTQPIKLALMD